MFGFLKEKLKKAVSIFSKKAAEEEKIVEKPKEIQDKKPEQKETKKEPKPEKKEIHEEKKAVSKPVKKEKPQIKKEAIEKETKILEEEKEIIKEEEKFEELSEEELPVEQEIKEILKEEEQKNLEEERIDKELEEQKIQKEEQREKKGFFSFFKRDKETQKEQEKPKQPEETEEKKGFFSKVSEAITTKKIDSAKFEELFSDLEMALLENNVAFEVIEKIKEDLSKSLVDKPLPRTQVEEVIIETLKKSIKEILEVKNINFLEKVRSKKPFVICFVGINGSGKTTTISKVARLLQKNNLSCVMAASDTFRAAAIDQLQHHADKLKIKLIKQDYGADPAAVAFDAIRHAETKNIDVVLVDTAGRMHSNSNLIDEMKKIIRVAKPDLKIFVGESITGNDCIEQAKEFNDAVNIDGIVLSKADVDEKGGAALSVSYVTKKPIIFIGTGQEYDDLREFSSSIILENLGL